MTRTRIMVLGAVIFAAQIVRTAAADVFHMPAGQISLQFVTVGDPGNAPDTRESNISGQDPGAVAYVYQIGKYDVTAAQYCQFLNAVAKADACGVYNSNMAITSRDRFGCGIARYGSRGGYAYAVLSGRENFPVNYLSWGSAARFCNWLHNGQPTSGRADATTSESGAYNVAAAIVEKAGPRNLGAKYWIPTEHEWYKAAYYKGGSTHAGYWSFATQSDTPPKSVLSTDRANHANYQGADRTNGITPVGLFAASPGPYGTFDQAGNVWQWTDRGTWIDDAHRVLRGGSFHDDADFLRATNRFNSELSFEYSGLGFRVATRAVTVSKHPRLQPR
jgi:formylglycine-generating enzyme required for sulfatase activity